MRKATAVTLGVSGLVFVGLGIAAAVGVTLVLHHSSPERMLENSLADAVDSAQDDLWEYRDELLTDADATIAEVGFIADARPLYKAPPAQQPMATYTLLGMASGQEGVTLTLATSATASTGGGFFYEQTSGTVCFDLVFSAHAETIETLPTDCTDGDGHGLNDLWSAEEQGRIVPLDALDVRRTVTPTDFPEPQCQCYSGSVCDCPGG